MRKSTSVLLEFASAVRIGSSSEAKVDAKFSLQRPKMPQRARVFPSSFLAPFLMSIIEKTRMRLNSPRLPLNESSRGGTDRPRYTAGALAQETREPLASLPPEFGIVSEHMTFEITPVARSMSADTTRFSNQANAG